MKRRRYSGFTIDGTRAMRASPRYFLAWYSAKSILLVVVAAALAYQLGKSRGQNPEPKPLPVPIP